MDDERQKARPTLDDLIGQLVAQATGTREEKTLVMERITDEIACGVAVQLGWARDVSQVTREQKIRALQQQWSAAPVLVAYCRAFGLPVPEVIVRVMEDEGFEPFPRSSQ